MSAIVERSTQRWNYPRQLNRRQNHRPPQGGTNPASRARANNRPDNSVTLIGVTDPLDASDFIF